MKKHHLLLLIAFIFFNASSNAQQTGVNTKTPHSSAILDLSTNINKTMVLPSISITSITDVSLINGGSPANGLMIYKPTPTGNLLDGIYIWDNGIWNLLSTNLNNITNFLLTGSQNDILALNTDNVYQNIIPTTGFSTIQNDITGSSSVGGLINLPAGKYTVEVNLDLQTPNEALTISKSLGSTTVGPVQKTTHLHTYNARLVDVAGNPLSTTASINALSNTSSSVATIAKKHAVNFVFTFETSLPTGINIQLCHVSGGTYHFISGTNPGGVLGTSSSVDIKEVIVHIQKRL